MTDKVFLDKSIEPNEDTLLEVLGDTAQYWQKLEQYLNDEYGDIDEEWKYYYEKYGWFLQIVRKKKTLFWLTPYEAYFRITFWFGDKAVEKIENSALPIEIKEKIRNAQEYQIGRSLPIDVKQSKDLQIVFRLLEIKMNFKEKSIY